jgi:hypothetical protein
MVMSECKMYLQKAIAQQKFAACTFFRLSQSCLRRKTIAIPRDLDVPFCIPPGVFELSGDAGRLQDIRPDSG